MSDPADPGTAQFVTRTPHPRLRDLVVRAGLADEVGWSRRHLSQRFSDEFGIGPMQAARLLRFGRARKLVVAGSRSLAEVAIDCGYADQASYRGE
jgi:transcriptional regulator GlxA family with amidase domain